MLFPSLSFLCSSYMFAIFSFTLLSYFFSPQLTKHGRSTSGISKIFYFLLYLTSVLILRNSSSIFIIHPLRRLFETLFYCRKTKSKMTYLHLVHGLLYFIVLSSYIKNVSDRGENSIQHYKITSNQLNSKLNGSRFNTGDKSNHGKDLMLDKKDKSMPYGKDLMLGEKDKPVDKKDRMEIEPVGFTLVNIIQAIAHYRVYHLKIYEFSHYYSEILIYSYVFLCIKTAPMFWNLLYILAFVYVSIQNRLREKRSC